nr:hypothetical protein [Tanacetum cinerariifolium]
MLRVLRVKMVINSPWLLSKNWLVQKQTVFGKDSSNPYMADSLAKIVWFSTYHITCMKSWLVQKQTTLGKDTSNPLIVDSLLKTIWFSIHHHLTIEVLAILEQTATEKSDASEGFAQIIDFLSGSYIHYALTVSPPIYISCIKQFWNTAMVKRSGDVTSAKKTTWNEFSCSMASAVICLATAVLTFGLAILVDDAEFCLAALTSTCPDLVAIVAGTKFLFG